MHQKESRMNIYDMMRDSREIIGEKAQLKAVIDKAIAEELVVSKAE